MSLRSARHLLISPSCRRRVVLMSATVDAEKISAFFGGCPTLSVPGRTFPVNSFFLEDAIEFSKWFITGDSPYARRCESALCLFSCLNIRYAHAKILPVRRQVPD